MRSCGLSTRAQPICATYPTRSAVTLPRPLHRAHSTERSRHSPAQLSEAARRLPERAQLARARLADASAPNKRADPSCRCGRLGYGLRCSGGTPRARPQARGLRPYRPDRRSHRAAIEALLQLWLTSVSHAVMCAFAPALAGAGAGALLHLVWAKAKAQAYPPRRAGGAAKAQA